MTTVLSVEPVSAMQIKSASFAESQNRWTKASSFLLIADIAILSFLVISIPIHFNVLRCYRCSGVSRCGIRTCHHSWYSRIVSNSATSQATTVARVLTTVCSNRISTCTDHACATQSDVGCWCLDLRCNADKGTIGTDTQCCGIVRLTQPQAGLLVDGVHLPECRQ